MSLQVWLPLNKDLRVINFENISVDNYGVTLDNDGLFGKSYYFNGSSYLQFNNLNISGNRQLSLSFWCYSTNGNLSSFFVCRNSGTHQISLYSNNLYFRDSKHSSLASFTFEQPSVNVWTNYVIIYNNGNWIIYKNGVKVKEQVYSAATLNNINEVRIGRYQSSSGNEYFTGKLNDFRVYENALTEKDVKRIYQQKLFELIPYSGVKDVLFDRSGLMNMPLVNNGAIFQNNALYFNGSAKLRPKNGNVGFTMDDGTLSVWFTIETSSTTYQIIYIDSVSKLAIGYVKRSNAFITTCNGTGSKTCFKATDVKFDGSINNVIVSYNTGKTPQFLLVNGVQAVTTTADVWTESSGLTIGSRMYNTAQSGFKGKLLKVGVYNRQFTQDEAVELYNSERGMFLPDDYIQLEYIQSNGTQYIDTGINGFNSGDWEIYCEWMSVAAPAQSYGYIFGVYEGENYNSYRLIHKTTSTTEYYVSAKSKAGGGSILLSNVALNEKHSIKIKNGTFTCDGVSYTASTTGTSLPSANTMLLFKSSNNLYSKCRIYSTWAKKDGILKYNMIPSKRKSDNVIGMYDMITRKFFTNSGTGSFTGA